MLRCILFFIACFSCYISAAAIDFETKVTELKNLPFEEFIQQFPTKEYLTNFSLTDVAQLEKHRQFLQGQGLNGDEFLMAVFQEYIEASPISITDLTATNELLEVGEVWSHSDKYLPDSVFIYMVGSDMIFETIADTLKKLIDQKAVDVKDFKVKYLVQRLIDNKYAIDIPVSNWTKLYKYVQEGRWSYIAHKFTSTYKKEFITALLIGGSLLAGIGGYFFSYRKRKHKLQVLTKE